MAKKYARGIPPPRIGLLMNEDQQRAAIDDYLAEQNRRMHALADSLGIPKDITRWYRLALHLAEKHVPELKQEKPLGAKKKWDSGSLGLLAAAFTRHMEAEGCSEEEAALALAKKKPWKSMISQKSRTAHVSPDPAAALLRQYQKAKKDVWSAISIKAMRYHEETKTMAEWDALVAKRLAK